MRAHFVPKFPKNRFLAPNSALLGGIFLQELDFLTVF